MSVEPSGPLVPTTFPKPSAERPLILLSREVPEMMLTTRVIHWPKKRPMLFILSGTRNVYYVAFPITTGKPNRRAAPSHSGLYRAFTGERPRGMSAFKIMVPGAKVHEVGKLQAIDYISGKEYHASKGKKSREDQEYVHETAKPHPTVYSTPCGQTWVVVGGRMEIGKDQDDIAWLDN